MKISIPSLNVVLINDRAIIFARKFIHEASELLTTYRRNRNYIFFIHRWRGCDVSRAQKWLHIHKHSQPLASIADYQDDCHLLVKICYCVLKDFVWKGCKIHFRLLRAMKLFFPRRIYNKRHNWWMEIILSIGFFCFPFRKKSKQTEKQFFRRFIVQIERGANQITLAVVCWLGAKKQQNNLSDRF